MIIAPPEFKNVDKYDLLMQKLTEKAHDREKSNDYNFLSYTQAMKRLEEAYGQPVSVLKRYKEEMLNLPKINGDTDLKGLRSLLEKN